MFFVLWRTILLQKFIFKEKDEHKLKILLLFFICSLSVISVFPFMTRVLTRNGLTPFWSMLSLFGLAKILMSSHHIKGQLSGCFWLWVSFLGGIASYTSFKPYFLGLMLSLFFYLIWHRSYQLVRIYFFTIILFMLSFLCLGSQGNQLMISFTRGSYVIYGTTFLEIFQKFIYNLIFPFVYIDRYDLFMAEIVHQGFGKAPFPWLYGILIIVGILRTILSWKSLRMNIFSFCLFAWPVVALFFRLVAPA